MTKLIYLCLTFLTFASVTLTAADRVALVIGNSAYQHANKLANATSDSTAIARLLRNAGFEVIGSAGGISDANTLQFYDALEKFKQAAVGAKVGLVYYAGHGVEVDGKNYLLPVDASLESDGQLRTQAVALDTILDDMMEARLPAKMVILDCCRDNPLTRSWLTTRSTKRGMAEVKEDSLPEATMIMFSTAPGKTALDGTGGNSPFTKSLLRNLVAPEKSCFDGFFAISDEVVSETKETQIPWISFNGAAKEFRAMSFGLPAAEIPIMLPTPSLMSTNSTLNWVPLSATELRRFRKLVPGGTQYYKINLQLGHSVTGLSADISAPKNRFGVLYQDECTFTWGSLQKEAVTTGADLNGRFVFSGGGSEWVTDKKRTWKHISPNQPEPFWKIDPPSAGMSINSIDPEKADLSAPVQFLSYGFKVYHHATKVKTSNSDSYVGKVVLFVFSAQEKL